MAINIEYSYGFNREFYDRAAWKWSTSRLEREGKNDAKQLMKQWGLGWGSDGKSTIPFSEVRTIDSETYVPCDDLENIVSQSVLNYDRFYREREAACKTCRRAKRNKKINMYKWAYIRDWSQGAVASQSEFNGYNTCEAEAYEQEVQEALDLQQGFLDEADAKAYKGMSNATLAGLVGGFGLVLTLVLIKGK